MVDSARGEAGPPRPDIGVALDLLDDVHHLLAEKSGRYTAEFRRGNSVGQ